MLYTAGNPALLLLLLVAIGGGRSVAAAAATMEAELMGDISLCVKGLTMLAVEMGCAVADDADAVAAALVARTPARKARCIISLSWLLSCVIGAPSMLVIPGPCCIGSNMWPMCPAPPLGEAMMLFAIELVIVFLSP